MKEVDDAIEAEVKRRLAEKDAERDRTQAEESLWEAVASVRKAAKILGKKSQNVPAATIEKLTTISNQLSDIGDSPDVTTRAVPQAKEA